MRTLLSKILVPAALLTGGVVVSATAASAEPTRTVCYAGSQTAHVGKIEQTSHAVMERTYDPGKNEIRQRAWSDKNGGKEVTMTGRVDPKAGTFEFEDPDLGAKGTGKLEGKPWHWTSFEMKVTRGDLVIASTSKVSDTGMRQQATMSNKGQSLGTVTGDLTAFDCKHLDDKRAELTTAAAAAKAAAPAGSGAAKK